jgi:hypothetical protein
MAEIQEIRVIRVTSEEGKGDCRKCGLYLFLIDLLNQRVT